MDKEILTTVTFKENCEYESSTIKKKISIPEQIVQIELSAPINRESNRGQTEFYYNDKIELQAIVFQEKDNQRSCIKTGRVEFYFQPDNTSDSKLINTEHCKLNKNGTAAVAFKPTSSGKVYAKYVDDNDFYTAITSTNTEGISNVEHLTISDIPVNIEFVDTPPYITSLHDEVNIKVHVTHGKDHTDIKYGHVTFMHYLVYDDDANLRVPKAIGNPVPVINGEASISYIPVQEDDYGYINPENDTEPEKLIENNQLRYTEYIRASFNYSGKFIDTDKGDYKWSYYGSSSKWTSINVAKRNSLTISPLSLATNGESDIYQCSENDVITLTAVLKDKNDEYINFNNHSGIVTFHVKCAHAHPKQYYVPGSVPTIYSTDFDQTNSDFNFVEHTFDIDATYVQGQNGTNDEFIAELIYPLPGFYTISATSTQQIDDGELLINYEGTDDDIYNDKIYEINNESNIIYLSSNYADITEQDIHLVWDTDSLYKQTNSNVQSDLSCEVIGLDYMQMNILDGQKCYFYVPKTNKTYEGTLSCTFEEVITEPIIIRSVRDRPKMPTALVGVPSEDIVFNIADNYQIYMYIPSGVYTNDLSADTYHHDITSYDEDNVYDFYLPYITGDTLTLQIRDDIDLSLKINSVNNTIPASITYTLTGKYISTQITAQLFAQEINSSIPQLIDTIDLYKAAPSITKTITIDTPGEYIIYAEYEVNKSNEETIEIEGERLTQQLLESSKNIFASINNTIGMYLSTSNNNIDLVDTTKIKAYLYDSNKANKKEIIIESSKKIDNNTLYLVIKPSSYKDNGATKINYDLGKEGTWYVELTYIDNNNKFISNYSGDLTSFKTFLDTPNVKIMPYDNNYSIEVTGPHFNVQASNILVIEVKFLRGPQLLGEGVLITDESGYGSFNDKVDNHNTISWWEGWDNIQLIFTPYKSELINIIKNNEYPYDALKSRYGLVFDYASITDTKDLYWQLQDNDNKYVYKDYKSTTTNVARPNSL